MTILSPAPQNAKFQEIIEKVKQYPKKKVKLAIADIDGVLRGKVILLDKFLSAVENGFGFCDVVFGWDLSDRCYDNADHTGWHTGYPDAQARIDLQTFRTVPWDDSIPFFLADLENQKGSPLEIAPRNLLKKVFQEAVENGFYPIFSQEFEWFNFDETSEELHRRNFQDPTPLTQGMFGYSLLRFSQNAPFFNDLFDQLLAFDIPLEGLHTETGPGVYEAAIQYTDILTAADRATLFKASVKEIAHYHGIIPTFMAKWSPNYPGTSGHIHQSLWDTNQKENLFYDPTDPLQISPLMRHYIAGQLYCLPYILPMFAPTVNSYKRLVEGHWAPTTLSWGIDNRTAALRALPTGPRSTRIEHRVVGADVNPYLAMAASLTSGLYGIKHSLELAIPPAEGNAYQMKTYGTLPKSLGEATQKMKDSSLANELFGEVFTRHFIQTREWEWSEYLKALTDWEFKRYFEIV